MSNFTTRALPVHITLSDLDHISGAQQCRTVLTENVMFLSSKAETLQDCYAGWLDYEYTSYFTFAHIQGRQLTCFLICQKLLKLAFWWTLFKECLQTLHNHNLTWDLPIAVLPSRVKPLSIAIQLC